MKKYLILLFICVFIISAKVSLAATTSVVSQGIACSSEAKICPDGSSVGRQGPNCEFAQCPNVQNGDNELDKGMIKNSDIKEKTKADIQQIKDTAVLEKESAKADIAKIRDASKQKMESLKANIQSIKNKTKAKVAETRIIGREDALQKFDNTIEKVDTLKENIDTKITKLEAQGINTTEAKTAITTAENKITDAKTKIAEASTLLASSTNELSKNDKIQLKQLTLDIQSLIVDSHQALNQAVVSLKGEVQNKINTTKSINNTSASTDSGAKQ